MAKSLSKGIRQAGMTPFGSNAILAIGVSLSSCLWAAWARRPRGQIGGCSESLADHVLGIFGSDRHGVEHDFLGDRLSLGDLVSVLDAFGRNVGVGESGGELARRHRLDGVVLAVD